MFIRDESEFQVKNQSAMTDASGVYGFAMIYCSYMLEISSTEVLRTKHTVFAIARYGTTARAIGAINTPTRFGYTLR